MRTSLLFVCFALGLIAVSQAIVSHKNPADEDPKNVTKVTSNSTANGTQNSNGVDLRKLIRKEDLKAPQANNTKPHVQNATHHGDIKDAVKNTVKDAFKVPGRNTTNRTNTNTSTTTNTTNTTNGTNKTSTNTTSSANTTAATNKTATANTTAGTNTKTNTTGTDKTASTNTTSSKNTTAATNKTSTSKTTAKTNTTGTTNKTNTNDKQTGKQGKDGKEGKPKLKPFDYSKIEIPYFIEIYTNQARVTRFGIKPSEKVLAIKQRIEKEKGFAVQNQTIKYNGQVLEDDKLLSSYNVKYGVPFELILKVTK
eukprot:TRINITY_DN19778_c0_g1_i1.p1 TRINITY_DN19778_c0_g1~~TRINITY_DN19778_c0_g1_i1.p1  ORF type:complete len:310 (+),score=88.13 TRINITY_DN19778_c0_g1_i1:155-1084(+)